MPGIIEGYNYDIIIVYRQKNRIGEWEKGGRGEWEKNC